ncbi:hypothetical protein [Stackebrandtia nassauensis]|uniref:DUF4386 family protein n=1 Tax=Stackebrandtia nassauensis (strain DSM 44728 / CIP 108903 / NRRL B-16338 / NBRC 102104 / LLR-40K-21) TaxID=446470 RepID=D3Q1P7_STANL|nr:hypothetical protein [Stackebrandtia nassauensis]ADD39895.1 hypothetical protein Snas_0175 [Stackebrandtia nassauensis DSM 44728]
MSAISKSDRITTGLAGLLSGVLSILMVGLYFVYDGAPPPENVLGRNLITVTTFIGFLIFGAGLARLLRQARGGDAGLSGSIAVTSLLTYVAVTLVSASLEVGTSLWKPNSDMDPTVDGPLAAGMVLLHGPIARGLVAAFLITLTISAARTGLLRRWVLTGNIILALTNLALVPSLFFGMNAANFYAANGWGAVASIGLINVIWFATLGGALLRSRAARQTPVPTPAPAPTR